MADGEIGRLKGRKRNRGWEMGDGEMKMMK